MASRRTVAYFVSLLLTASFTAAPETPGRAQGPGVRGAYPYSNAYSNAGRRQQSPPGKAGAAKDLRGLITGLRAGGATVRRAGKVSQPFFSAKGRALVVNGEQVQVFEYAKASAAGREAGLVDPSGSGVGTSQVTWTGPPHFYKGGRLIVLYVGSNRSVIKALEGALGPQFAGQ